MYYYLIIWKSHKDESYAEVFITVGARDAYFKEHGFNKFGGTAASKVGTDDMWNYNDYDCQYHYITNKQVSEELAGLVLGYIDYDDKEHIVEHTEVDSWHIEDDEAPNYGQYFERHECELVDGRTVTVTAALDNVL